MEEMQTSQATQSPLSSSQQLFNNAAKPVKEKWWKLPKMVYLTIAALFLISMGSTAYLLFAPSSASRPFTLPQFSPPDTTQAEITPTQAASSTAPTLTPTITITPYPTTDPTFIWRTYKNFAYGYSFRYPMDWAVTDFGNLEPKVPSYVSANPETATASSTLAITVSSSTRTYNEELTLHSSTRTSVTINGLTGVKTEQKDSAGNISFHVILNGKNYVYILVGKKAYESTFNLMYPTFAPL